MWATVASMNNAVVYSADLSHSKNLFPSFDFLINVHPTRVGPCVRFSHGGTTLPRAQLPRQNFRQLDQLL